MLSSSSPLYKRYQFFKQHAMSSVGHDSAGALALARAEIWAEEHELRYTWEWDEAGDLADHACWCPEAARVEAGYGRYPDPQCAHEVLVCTAWYGEQCQASLGGIIDADRHYGRVVEAELALEAQAEAEAFVYY